MIWVIVISLLPLLLVAYLTLIYTILWRRDGCDPDKVLGQYFGFFYFPFVSGITAVYVIWVGFPEITVRPAAIFAIPFGALIYYVTTSAWRTYTGDSLRRGHRDVFFIFPGVLVSVPEELLFREGLAPVADIVGPVGYVVYSSLLFGMYHYKGGHHEVVFKTLLGVLLALSYLGTESIVVPMLIHFGHNLAWLLFVSDRFP